MTTTEVFDRIHKNNEWNAKESAGGPGSTLAHTAPLREWLPGLFGRLRVNSILDAGCADSHWYRVMERESSSNTLEGLALFPEYYGVDVSRRVIVEATKQSDMNHWYAVGDFITQRVPDVDLILCRHVLQHLSAAQVSEALDNFQRSHSTWLLATTYPGMPEADIETGGFYPYDLEAQFGMPEPDQWFEEPNAQYREHLALWRIG